MSRKALVFLILALVAFAQLIFSWPVLAAEKVIAYYFHGNIRCPTCHKLEQYSEETVEGNFKEELASGKLEFKAVNVEDKGNEHYVNDYNIYTKSLILSKVTGGKETSWKNLDKIWEYVGNKQKFTEYVTKEVREFLKGT